MTERFTLSIRNIDGEKPEIYAQFDPAGNWMRYAEHRAALTDAEATIVSLTEANAALAQDNARLGKRVDAGLRLVDSAVNGLWDDETLVIARAWLAGGDA